MIAAFQTHTCIITRVSTPTPVSDIDNPTETTTVVAAGLPCRFDRSAGRRIAGVVATNRVVGRLFLDPFNTDGSPLSLTEKDSFQISGETGVYVVDRLDKVYAMDSFHHYEVDLTDQKPA